MSKIIKVGYLISKLWAIIGIIVMIFGTSNAIKTINPTVFELIFYLILESTVFMTPLAIMRYIKSQKQKEIKSAI